MKDGGMSWYQLQLFMHVLIIGFIAFSIVTYRPSNLLIWFGAFVVMAMFLGSLIYSIVRNPRSNSRPTK